MQTISSEKKNWRSRFKAAAVHLSISLFVAIFSAGLIFGFWYPWPFRSVSGGQNLFFLIMTVDIVLGPLLTFVAFDIKKTKSHLVRDLAVIGLIQLAGLGYGIYTIFLARPVAVVFEVDQFRVVNYADVKLDELPQALPQFRSLPLNGPWILGAKRPTEAKAKSEALFLALGGFDIGTRPSLWEPVEAHKEAILKQARPIEDMYRHYDSRAGEIDSAVSKSGRTKANLKFLPLLARDPHWSVLVDAKTAEVVGYVPLDGYF